MLLKARHVELIHESITLQNHELIIRGNGNHEIMTQKREANFYLSPGFEP